MTPFEGALFVILAIMVLVWFVCVRKLSQQLRDRHFEKYDEMRLAEMWPRGLEWLSSYDNSRPVIALLRFLLCREDAGLHDADVSRVSAFMRWMFYVYMGLFLLLGFLIVRQASESSATASQTTVGIASPAQQRREQAFRLHRDNRWEDAIAVYDQLLHEDEKDAKLHYWRGMAHWRLDHTDEALQDFRRVIELDPTNFEAYRSADRILSRQQRWDEILEIWDAYIARTPTSAEAYFERGGTNFHKGDLAAAQADAAKACELGKAEACQWVERVRSR
jgi:tetratricopeptide (TPR) repeat protein